MKNDTYQKIKYRDNILQLFDIELILMIQSPHENYAGNKTVFFLLEIEI